MANFQDELQVALDAVRQASRLCRSVQAAITDDVLQKKDRSPVTVADFGSQAVICRWLGDAFRSDPIIGEEDAAELREGANARFIDRVRDELDRVGIAANGDEICRWIDRANQQDYCDRFWTLDPIDGTKGFLRGEQYAISLALIEAGKIQVAVLGCPNLPCGTDPSHPLGSLFHAVSGSGSFVQPLDRASPPEPIQVSSTSNGSQARFCESVESGHSAHDDSATVAARLGMTASPVRMDSQAKYATVARGDADIYLRMPTRQDYREKIWDHAGGVLIVEEAGGTVTDVRGRPLDFTHGRELTANQGVIVSNGHLHPSVLKALESVSNP